MSKSRYVSIKDDSFKAVIGFILILFFIFAISSFFVNDGNNNSNTGGDGEDYNPNLITFTVGQTTLQAEIGMTWGEWVNSSYNPGTFHLSNEFVCISNSGYAVFTSTGVAVLKGDRILRNAIYHADLTPGYRPVDYYLVGFINGADYGSAYDYETIGDYRFVDGKLVVTFDAADNYVFVKTGDNANWFMASAYCTDTTVTLANTNIGTTEKLYVPGGVEITFTLVINEDDTLTLSYTAATTDPDTGEDDNPNLITFTVGNDTLQAERGMTWSQLLADPKYNKGFDQNGEYITISTGAHILYLYTQNGAGVKLSDTILEGGVYYFSTVCPDPDLSVLDFYLVGFINGADYGSAYDYETIGDYKFVDGKLVVTFDAADNYVFVKTGDNVNWFMASAYCTDTTVTLANTNIGTTEKLYVPGGVEITFTLVINDDYTLTLSYTAATSDPDPDIGGDGEGDNSNKIFFNIGVTKYFAENGMTWGEWIDSDYDSGPFVLSDDNISSGAHNGELVYTFDGNIVLKDDLIDDGAIYRLIIPDNSDPTPDPDPDIGGDGEGDNSNKIFFCIGATKYFAENGMTWSEWIDSDYDSGPYVLSDDNISCGTRKGLLVYTFDGNIVLKDDLIDDGAIYRLIIPDNSDPTPDPDPDSGGDGEDYNPNLITFTVGQTTLQAESGMTWSQWLADSKYNIDDFVQNGKYISIGAENLYLYTQNGAGVKLSDTILEGGVYYFSTVCPDPDLSVLDFYLVGFINGADYGSAYDYETIGDYRFVDGKLVVTFDAADNYVFVKTGDNANWFMASAYCTDTTVTLANTTTGTSEKLYVPGGVEITFTLVINEDDTLTLSYTAATSDPDTGEEDNPNLITFTVGNSTLQAESGMTWSELLLDPKYNTGFDQNGEYITISTGAHILYLCEEDGTRVKPSDEILEGGVYYFSTV